MKRSRAPARSPGLSISTAPARTASITTTGRLDRQALAASQVSVVLPRAEQERIAGLIEGGGTTAAYLALILFALDKLERDGTRLKLEISS